MMLMPMPSLNLHHTSREGFKKTQQKATTENIEVPIPYIRNQWAAR
jgi:hypothetical protein